MFERLEKSNLVVWKALFFDFKVARCLDIVVLVFVLLLALGKLDICYWWSLLLC